MRFILLFLSIAFGPTTFAHFIFSTLITNSGESTNAVRIPTSNSPIRDFTSKGATCNVNLKPATETVSVAAGSKIGFKLADGGKVFHPGPAAMYLGQAPGNAADWDGSGSRWFKIAEWGATFNPFNFTSLGMGTITATIPSSVLSGEYLIRIEQFGLHVTGSPELYVSCAQIKITGGGSGSPNKVSIPGYITNNDPMLILNIYWPVPTSYNVPGPSVYSAGGSTTPSPSPAPPQKDTPKPAPTPSPSPAPPQKDTPKPAPTPSPSPAPPQKDTPKPAPPTPPVVPPNETLPSPSPPPPPPPPPPHHSCQTRGNGHGKRALSLRHRHLGHGSLQAPH